MTVGVFNLVPEVSKSVLIFFSFILFSIFYFVAVISTIVFQVIYLFFCFSFFFFFLLLILSSELFIAVVCSLVFLGLLLVFILYLHSFSEILDHLHFHYSELFFWKVAYLYFI